MNHIFFRARKQLSYAGRISFRGQGAEEEEEEEERGEMRKEGMKEGFKGREIMWPISLSNSSDIFALRQFVRPFHAFLILCQAILAICPHFLCELVWGAKWQYEREAGLFITSSLSSPLACRIIIVIDFAMQTRPAAAGDAFSSTPSDQT